MTLVSIVIPARNEEEVIGKVLIDINKEIFKLKKYQFEVIVVDDGSSDKTSNIARKYGAKVILNIGLHGKGKALIKGFREAKGDIIIMLDADYSHRPEDISEFLKKIDEGYGLVIGSRYTGGSDEYNLVRSFGNISLTTAFKIFFGIPLTDALNGYKAFKKSVIKKYSYFSKDFEIEIELIANALKERYTIGEVPSHERERAGGKMKSRAYIHGPKFLFAIIRHGFAYRWNKLFR